MSTSSNTHQPRINVALLSEPNKYRPLTVYEVDALPDPVWMLKNFLQARTVSVVYGDKGTGKSFLVHSWMMCIALGTPWLGHDVTQGVVFYIAAEGAIGYKKRRKAYCHHFGIDVVRLADNFFLIPLAVPLMNPDEVSKLIEALRDTLPPGKSLAAVVFDTYNRCIAGENENSPEIGSKAVEVVTDITRKFDCHILFVHHSGKDPLRGPRGSSALADKVDTVIKVERNGKRRNEITATVCNQKDADEIDPIHLDLHPVVFGTGEFENSCVILPRTAVKSDLAKPSKRQQRTLDALAGDMTWTEWNVAAKPISDSTMSKHLKALLDMGLIEKIDLPTGKVIYRKCPMLPTANFTMQVTSVTSDRAKSK